METRPDRLIHSYGRRRGRPLRNTRAALMDGLLPKLAIPEAPADGTLDPQALFAVPCEAVWLEIGFGGGEHLAAQAEAHPTIGFIGAEPYINGISALLAHIEQRGLGNIRLWPDDIRQLLPALRPGSLGRVFILFPDPWPKLRHHKRRLIAAPLLDELARLMPPGAELRFATDDPGYLEWSLERLTAHPGFQRLDPQADMYARPVDWPRTRYEAKGLAGHPPAFLRYRRRA